MRKQEFGGKLISHLNFVNRKQQLAVESDKKVSAKVERLEGVTEVEEGLGTDVDDDVVGQVELCEEGEGGEGVGAQGAKLVAAQGQLLEAVARAEQLKCWISQI